MGLLEAHTAVDPKVYITSLIPWDCAKFSQPLSTSQR
jgi:hypothetical protein